jgi:hypothetical protein
MHRNLEALTCGHFLVPVPFPLYTDEALGVILANAFAV